MVGENPPPLSAGAINQMAQEIMEEIESNSGDYIDSIEGRLNYISKSQHREFINSLEGLLSNSKDPEIRDVVIRISSEFPAFSSLLYELGRRED